MKFEMKILRNGDAERVIGRVWADHKDPRATALDLPVLNMSIEGLPEFGHLVYQDDEWAGHHASRDDVYAWEREHRPKLYSGDLGYDRTGLLVEATADMFPLSWQPIGLMFSDGATVWSSEDPGAAEDEREGGEVMIDDTVNRYPAPESWRAELAEFDGEIQRRTT